MNQAEILFKEILACDSVRKGTTFVIDKEVCENENTELAKAVAGKVTLEKHSYCQALVQVQVRAPVPTGPQVE